MIRALAAYGADLGKVALDGNTPLHFAARQGFGPICKFLAQRGKLSICDDMNVKCTHWESFKLEN